MLQGVKATARFCILAMACQMLSDPASISPLQISNAIAGWIQHHVVAAQKLALNKMRIRLLVLSQYIQILAFMYGFPSDCEPWPARTIMQNCMPLGGWLFFHRIAWDMQMSDHCASMRKALC